MKKFTQENLLNALSIASGNETVFLLGAGCSISSGCMSAGKMVTEFKRRIYCSENGLVYDPSSFFESALNDKVNERFKEDSAGNDYSYYFEKCFPNVNDRTRFVKQTFLKSNPSYGYLCFAGYVIKKGIKYILTTNFDRLCAKALKKLDFNCDLAVHSDHLIPNEIASLNLVELHGDFNYDSPKNTEFELESLSKNVKEVLKTIHPSRIVVIGYSGQDKSVMDAMMDLARSDNPEFIWCTVQESDENERISRLLSLNNGSGYCMIDGFDELFLRLFKMCGFKNDVIESEIKSGNSNDFKLIQNNCPENISTNANYLIRGNDLYVFQGRLTDQFKEMVRSDGNVFGCEYKGFVYCFGDLQVIRELYPSKSIEIINVERTSLPLDKKCYLIKNFILLSLKQRGFSIFKGNVFETSSSTTQIREGLSIRVDVLNGRITLISDFNYFAIVDHPDMAIISQINKNRSFCYASKNYANREKYLKIFFADFSFSFFDFTAKFESKPIGNISGSTDDIQYNVVKEPLISVGNNESVNQVMLINEYGPRNIRFSPGRIKVGILCPKQSEPKLSAFLGKVSSGSGASGKYLVPEYQGFEQVFRKKIEFVTPFLAYNSLSSKIRALPPEEFAKFMVRGVRKIYQENQVDIVVIYAGKDFESKRNDGGFDLHDYVKVHCADSFKTQFLKEETIDSADDINKILFNFSVAIYTKTIGMPWKPSFFSNNSLFLGMSFGINSQGINVGCSQMFDGAGQGLKLIVSQIEDKKRRNQFLSYEEAYKLGCTVRSTYYKTSKIEPLDRVVIHRSSPFLKEEIAGFKAAFEGIRDLNLIEITGFCGFNAFKFGRYGTCLGYPLLRGSIIKRSNNSAYVWIDGSICERDIMGGLNYRNSGKGMGHPLKITKYYGESNLNDVVSELMMLSKMDFNSSDVIYSKMPVTIKYSQIVCDLLKQGSLPDDLISFEYIM